MFLNRKWPALLGIRSLLIIVFLCLGNSLCFRIHAQNLEHRLFDDFATMSSFITPAEPSVRFILKWKKPKLALGFDSKFIKEASSQPRDDLYLRQISEFTNIEVTYSSSDDERELDIVTIVSDRASYERFRSTAPAHPLNENSCFSLIHTEMIYDPRRGNFPDFRLRLSKGISKGLIFISDVSADDKLVCHRRHLARMLGLLGRPSVRDTVLSRSPQLTFMDRLALYFIYSKNVESGNVVTDLRQKFYDYVKEYCTSSNCPE